MMNKILYILLFVLTFSLNVMAQEEEPDSNKNTSDETTIQQEQTPDSETTEQNKTQKSPETPDSFKPSEEISEDLGVSFPVDI